MMKFFFAMYLLANWCYLFMYLFGVDEVVRYARGPLYALMVSAPIVTGIIAAVIVWPLISGRRGTHDSR